MNRFGRRAGSVVSLGLVLGLWCVATPAQTTWPMYQGDASHSGALPIGIDPSKITLKWNKALVGGSPLNPVTAAEGKVFVSQVSFPDATLFALDKETGTKLWSQSFGMPGSLNPPGYDNGRVYVQTANNYLDTWFWSLDAETGEIAFKVPFDAQWEQYYAPTFMDGTAYIDGGTHGGMYAFDAISGEQKWFQPLQQYDQWTPAVDSQYAYAYTGDDSPGLYVFDRITGQLAYKIPDPSFSWAGWSMNVAPVLGSQQDVLVTHDGRLISFDLATQSVRWQVTDDFIGQPAVSGGVIYVLDSGSMHARDEATGAKLWNWVPGIDTLMGGVIVTASHALLHSNSTTYLVRLATHLSEWSWPKGGHLAIAESTIYIARSDGILTALQYQASPLVASLQPTKAKYLDDPPQVTIHGYGFAAAPNPHVYFGALEAKNVVVADDTTITCSAPRGQPGKVDIKVVNDNGSNVLAGGFAYTPLVEASGDYAPGGTITLSFEDVPGDAILGAWGSPFGPIVPTPQFGGHPGLAYPRVLFTFNSWPFDKLSLSFDIPAGIALPILGVQGLMGPSISAGDADWTNVVIFGG